MKRKRLFKIRSTAAVRCLEPNPYSLKFLGFSKIDRFPIFEMTLEEGAVVNFTWFAQFFLIDDRPDYTLQKEDIEGIASLENVFPEFYENKDSRLLLI